MATLNLLSAPPTRAAAGAPVLLSLAADSTGTSTYTGQVQIANCAHFVAGDTLTLNGYLFTARDVPAADLRYGEFCAGPQGNDTVSDSLAAAINDSPLFADYYAISNSIPKFVTFAARRAGSVWNSAVTLVTTATSPAPTLMFVSPPPAFISQDPNKLGWGCYVGIYAAREASNPQVPDYPNDPGVADFVAPAPEVLELPYADDNVYSFDLAPWLAGMLDAYPQAAYKLEYGEVYSTPTNPTRRRYPTATWPTEGVVWAFDAALPISSYADPREPQLLTPYFGPRPLCLIYGTLARVHLSAICDAAAGLSLSRELEYTDGTNETIDTLLHWSVSAGGVFDLDGAIQGTYVLDITRERPLQALVLVRIDDQSGESGGQLRYELSETELPEWLRFRNRLGGLEAWGFTAAEPGQKSTATTFERADGTTHTRRVELLQSVRLTSPLLTREAFDFLCAELATSVEIDYFRTDSPLYQRVNLTDFDAKADVLTGEYSIALTITPGTPFHPLTR